jgi:hypothetical protein
MLRVMRIRRPISRLVVSVLLFGLCVGCTSNGDDTSPSDTSGATTSTATAPTITLTRKNAPFLVTIDQPGDGIHKADRVHLRRAIGAPIAAWFDGGFLSPSYPTSDFPDAFGSWTTGAALKAGRDADVTTNKVLGPDLVALVADKQRAALYVFAEHGVTGGATARVRLAMTGEKQNGSLVRYAISGDVYLTRDKGQWSIFGYDLQRVREAS